MYTKDAPFVWMAVFRHLERGRTCGPGVSIGMSGENRIVSVDVTRVSNGGRREASQGLCETSQQKNRAAHLLGSHDTIVALHDKRQDHATSGTVTCSKQLGEQRPYNGCVHDVGACVCVSVCV